MISDAGTHIAVADDQKHADHMEPARCYGCCWALFADLGHKQDVDQGCSVSHQQGL